MGASLYPMMHSVLASSRGRSDLKGDTYKLILKLNHSDGAFAL